MRNGQCPKCNSATVYARTKGIYFSKEILYVETGNWITDSPFVSFICASCGYFENYVADRDKLAEVAKTWEKVPVTAA